MIFVLLLHVIWCSVLRNLKVRSTYSLLLYEHLGYRKMEEDAVSLVISFRTRVWMTLFVSSVLKLGSPYKSLITRALLCIYCLRRNNKGLSVEGYLHHRSSAGRTSMLLGSCGWGKGADIFNSYHPHPAPYQQLPHKASCHRSPKSLIPLGLNVGWTT